MRYIRNYSSLALALYFFCLTSVSASELGEHWSIDQLSKLSKSQTSLTDAQHRNLRMVSVGQMRIIAGVFHKLEKASETKARLILVRGNLPNAFAGPVDGRNIVGVNFAMLDLIANQEDQWSALLGHELAHLKLNHSFKGQMRRIPIDIVQRVIRHKTKNQNTRLTSQALGKLIDSKFSRDQERESDYLGAIWAVETGFSAYGAATLHESMHALLGNSSGFSFLTSHPSSSERVITLHQLAKRLEPEISEPTRTPKTDSGDFGKSELLRVGMFQQTVFAVMGTPTIKEYAEETEEWHYCETGKYADKFVALRFSNNKLIELQYYHASTFDPGVVIGDCSLNVKRGTY